MTGWKVEGIHQELAQTSMLASASKFRNERMMNMSENKKEQISIRVDSDVKDAFTAFCAKKNCSQVDGFGLLVNSLTKVEESSPDKERVIAFRNTMANMLALFEGSLVMAEESKAIAREEYAKQLDQNAATIDALTIAVKNRDSQIDELNQSLEAAIENRDKALQRVEAIEQTCSSLQGQLEEKSQRIREMTDDYEKTKSLPQRCNDLLEENKRLLEENNSLMEDKRQFESRLAEVERNADREQSKLRTDWYAENQSHIAELMCVRDEKHALALEVARLEKELELAKLAGHVRKDEETD